MSVKLYFSNQRHSKKLFQDITNSSTWAFFELSSSNWDRYSQLGIHEPSHIELESP